MAMAGIKSEQAISLLPKVADIATAAGLDLDKAVGMAADALAVFGKMTDDPLKLANNFQYVSDIMVKTANLANMDLSLMYEAVAAGGKEFSKTNQRVEDFGAAVDVLAANAIKGAEAGGAINTMMVRLAAPAAAGEQALKALGIRTQDAQGNILNFVDIIGQLNVAFRGLGTAKQAEYIDAIFGKNRYTAASALISAGVEGFRTYSTELEKAAGSTQQSAEVMRQSIQNKLAVLGSAATELGFKFVEAFKNKGVSAIEGLTMAIEKFDVTPLVEFASKAVDGISRFAGTVAWAVKTAWDFRGVIAAILIPMAALNIAFMITQGLIGIKDKVIDTYRTFKKIIDAVKKSTLLNAAAQGIQATATIIATAAQWAFNIAAAANPIVLIIAGIIIAIAALVGIIIFLRKNWDKVTEAVKEHSNKIMAVLTILSWPIGLIISMIKEVVSNFGRIKEALAATGLFDKLKEIGEGIKNFFGSIGEKIVSIFNTAKEKVSNFFGGIGEAVMSKIGPVVSWITNAWHTATSTIGGFFKGIFDAIYNSVKPELDWFAEKWLQIVSFFKDNAIINAIKVIGGTLLSGILAPIQGLLEILSYIPGLGHLAGKGAEKIEELRNFLKGVDGATVSAEVNVPEEVKMEFAPL
jgi:TP901 family phage tail tape measure protein